MREVHSLSVNSEAAAYAAGFFDGEGHIRITQHSRRCRTMTLQVSVVQATKEPLMWFKEKFEGTISLRTPPYRDKRRLLFTWQASSGCAERFLQAILPYLKIKQTEAIIALQFRGTFRPQHVVGGHTRMSDKEIEFRQTLAGKLKMTRKHQCIVQM